MRWVGDQDEAAWDEARRRATPLDPVGDLFGFSRDPPVVLLGSSRVCNLSSYLAVLRDLQSGWRDRLRELLVEQLAQRRELRLDGVLYLAVPFRPQDHIPLPGLVPFLLRHPWLLGPTTAAGQAQVHQRWDS